MKPIVFVCTGNVFRSFCAERALRKVLPQHVIYSRGLAPAIAPHASVIDAMRELGLSVDGHEPTPITGNDANAFYVAMSLQHQKLLREKFSIESVLYQQLAIGQNLSILDINEALPDYRQRRTEARLLVGAVIRYINDSAPKVSAEIVSRFNQA